MNTLPRQWHLMLYVLAMQSLILAAFELASDALEDLGCPRLQFGREFKA